MVPGTCQHPDCAWKFLGRESSFPGQSCARIFPRDLIVLKINSSPCVMSLPGITSKGNCLGLKRLGPNFCTSIGCIIPTMIKLLVSSSLFLYMWIFEVVRREQVLLQAQLLPLFLAVFITR